MYRADKFYGADRQVLDEISLSFLPGAKIGVLGPNGAGKSTLLRIMAGLEEPSTGIAELHPGATVGFLQQEPELDPAKDVRGNVEDGVRELRDLLDRFNAISAAFAEPDADFDALLAEQAKVQEQIDRHDAWSLDAQLDRAMDALRLPDGDRDVDDPLRRRAPPRRALPAAALLPRPAAPRRADEPPRRRVGRLARALPRRLQGHRRRGHPRSLLPRQRRRLDPRARPRQGAPVRGQLLLLARAEAGAPRARGEDGVGAPAHARPRARVGAHEPTRAAGEVEGAPHGLREAARRRARRQGSTASRSTSPPGPRLGDLVVEAEDVAKGFGDRLLVEDLTFSLPPGGIVGVIGPNGAGKTTLFRMIAGEEQPDGGELRVGDTVQLAYVDQSRGGLDPQNTVWKEISGGHDIDRARQARGELAAVRVVVQLPRRRPAEARRTSPAASATASTSRSSSSSGGNVLLLDEPTNDLDVDTLRALEDALLDFAGCAVVITHDRWFLDRIATHILAFEGDSQVTWFEGSWDEYAAWVTETRGPEALEPHRIKYKPLVRPS